MRPVKRSFTIAGHSTSISLEEPFWRGLKEVAEAEGCSLAALVERIDADRDRAGLSSAVRVWLLEYYRARSSTAERSSYERSPRPSSAGQDGCTG
jgi:predicted DNA-binding ribbon-helix-helix protein